MRAVLTCMMAAVALAGFADDAKVHVFQQTLVGGVATPLSDQTLTTGGDYVTQSAPAVAGYVFTHWSISRAQDFANRDRLGRAKESAPYHLYEETTLTANYLPEGEDADGDGVADGWEIYWYGDLTKTAADDTDGDGLTFAEELAAGTNPLMPNESVEGGIAWDDGERLQYNPYDMQAYTIRSEPEGQLFATESDYIAAGATKTTGSYAAESSTFAYWTLNGSPVVDRHGRALNQVTFTMGSEAVELVAHCVADPDLRAQYYWYGRETAMTSDTDGDGLTLAEEIAAGTNPLMPNESVEGGVVWDDGELLQYNIDGCNPYTIRSEPEGELFATQTDIVKVGAALTSPSCNPATTTFAYWTLNGVRQQDRHGRALDQVAFVMPEEAAELVAHCVADESERMQQYWYGAATAMSSDTDGDGLTLAEEIAAGTNPLMPNESVEGGVAWDDGEMLETDMQLYEQGLGVVVDGQYATLFTSPVAGAEGRTFADGGQIWPVVGDVNGDGLWDLVVCSETSTNVFVNVGVRGQAKFEEVKIGNGDVWKVIDLEMNSTAKLAGMSLDVAPVGALSATTNDTTLLVSDIDGRIWLYEPAAEDVGTYQLPTANYQLLHKVWGGSFDGFARGLMLAAVDWDDDGDLDCVCGTADGKLMLLIDPKVGRPANLRALAGVDSVLLTWQPTGQSRERGYRVYRAEGISADSSSAWTVVAQPSLPKHRDRPEVIRDYAYRVTSVSRFYTAGNSTPTETESVPSAPVGASLGKVALRWGDAAGFAGDEIAVDLGVENSLNLSGNGLSLAVAYDATALQPVRVEASGLTAGVPFAEQASGGTWTVTATGGTVAAGGGTLFRFVFRGLKETDAATVALASSAFRSVGGAVVLAARPAADAKVTVAKRNEAAAGDPAAVMPYGRGDVDGDGRLTQADKRLLAQLMNGGADAQGTRERLRAGDYNGNGQFDQDDYQLMKDDFKERGIE